MAEPWYWKLGFEANPFSIKPGSISHEVIGHPVEKIIAKIEAGSVQFIEAPHGSGKTSVLKSIISKFGGKGKLIYCSCIKDESLGIGKLLRNSSLAGKMFGKMPRKAIILVDEAQDVSGNDAKQFARLMKSGNLRSIVFFGTDVGLPIHGKISEPLKGGVTALSALTPDQSIELVRSRVGKLKLLPDYVIRDLCARSAGNPRKLLEYCELACRKAVEASIKELTVSSAAAMLKSAPKTSAPKTRRAR